MTNLKSNILITRTSSFINRANSPNTPNVRYASNKLENSNTSKLVKRSISNVGSIIINSNQKNFNNKSQQAPLFDDAIRALKTKKNDLRSKNVSPNSDNSDLSTSSSLSSSNNSSPTLKQRPLLNRTKTDLFLRNNSTSSNLTQANKPPQSQQPTPTSDANRIQIDLYRSSPTLFYIKEKYKMYLDWLNEKPNSKQLLNESNQSANQLNWYNYEKIVYLNEATGLDYFKYIQGEQPMPVETQQIKTPVKETPTRQINSSLSFNKTTKPNLKASVIRALSQQDSIKIKSKSKEASSPEPILVTNLSNSNNYKPSTTLNLKRLLNKLSESKEILNNDNSTSLNNQVDNNISKTKGVKFDSNNVVQIATSQQVQSQPGTITSLKPILKSSTNNTNAYNENYFNMNQASHNTNTVRRVSIISLNSSVRSDKNSSSGSASSTNKTIANNLNNTSNNINNFINNPSMNNANYSNLKLPPIVNCSEDFYAVLHDLEKDNLIK